MSNPLRVAFDINIVRTALLLEEKRDDPRYLSTVKAIWKAAEDNRVDGWIAAFSLPIIFGQSETYYFNEYYSRTPGASRDAARRQARAKAYHDVRRCINTFGRYPLTDKHIVDASDMMSKDVSCNDFEDNLQIICAAAAGIRIIVTDNVRDFGCARFFGVTILTTTQLHNQV